MSRPAETPPELVALSPAPRFMPPDWSPPAPAWAASFAQQTTPVVMAYFGTQFEGSDAVRGQPRIDGFFGGAEAPANVESASYLDRAGYRILLSAAYWTDPVRYEHWQDSSGFAAWWADPARLRERPGYFREVITVAPNRFETIFTRSCQLGVANTGGCPVVGPIREHNYWGAMRDRIAASASDDLISSYGQRLPRLGSPCTANRRLRIAVPENLAIIRSGQDWTNCAGAELAEYDESVRPALHEGMRFLRDHPAETGCCDLRFAQETGRTGAPLERTFGLGYFLTPGHLEKWASTHPTHLAIFSKFLTMVRDHGTDLKLKLWHKVAVLPATGQVFEYVNCHPDTALLPYFPSTEF